MGWLLIQVCLVLGNCLVLLLEPDLEKDFPSILPRQKTIIFKEAVLRTV